VTCTSGERAAVGGVGASRAASEQILHQLPHAQHPTMTRVMVVEDDVSIRDVLAELLTNEGYTTQTAANGLQALARMRTARPDAIVLDLMMPVMNGLQLVHAMRDESRLASIPLLVVTASLNAARDCERLNIQHWLMKPFEVDSVLSTIAELTASADP
jgi:CheY-like chemotaxis protein